MISVRGNTNNKYIVQGSHISSVRLIKTEEVLWKCKGRILDDEVYPLLPQFLFEFAKVHVTVDLVLRQLSSQLLAP